MLPVVRQAAAYLKEAGAASSRLWCYVLVRDVADAYERVMALTEMEIAAFAQPYRGYDGEEPTEEQRAFARWCNRKAVFRTCRWEEYKQGVRS